jgi:hypothetical protein
MPQTPPRLVDITREELREPPDPWEIQGAEADLSDFSRRRMAAYPRQPSGWDDFPESAAVALRASVGPFGIGDTLLVPRTPRPTGFGELSWVITPTAAVAVGEDSVAYWVDSASGGGVVARIPLDEIAALVDRTVLLYGRLEIVGAGQSIVIRYNTVSRQFVRGLMRGIRRSFWPGVETAPAGPEPETLTHKWANIARSPDMLPNGPEPRVLVAGSIAGPKPVKHAGIGALTPTELLLSIEPATGGGIARYGVDLVVAPRARVRSVEPVPAGVRLSVATAAGDVELTVSVDPVLRAGIAQAIVPALAGLAPAV